VAAKLRHPGIVSIHAVGSRDGLHYFTMDYLDGRTLDAFLREESHAGCLEPAPARAIVVAVARAVGHAHQHDIVHRDLKPNNVMVDSSKQVFVLDFGLAKPRGSGELTTAGAVVGTPQYMSPEQIDGRPATRRSDVYALGLVHYFLLVGEHLVQGDSLSSMIALHLSGACSSRVGSDQRVPESERATLMAMVQKDEQGRPNSMDEVVRMLEQSAAVATPAGLEPGMGAGPPVPAERGVGPELPPATTPGSPARQQARQRIGALLDKLGDPKKR
jgi:serine/threonine-protein kinase